MLVVGSYNVDAAIAAARVRIHAGIAQRIGEALAAARWPDRPHRRSAGQFARHIKRRLNEDLR